METPVETRKRRGRPLGSKNKKQATESESVESLTHTYDTRASVEIRQLKEKIESLEKETLRLSLVLIALIALFRATQ